MIHDRTYFRTIEEQKEFFMKLQKTVLVDFDGVLHSYERGWTGPVPEDPPMPGAVEFLEMVNRAGYEIKVFSTRCDRPEGRRAVEEWLAEHGMAKHISGVTCVKLPAVAYVDDRAVPFTGDWARVLAEIDRLASSRAHGAAPAAPGAVREILVAGSGETPRRAYPTDAGLDLFYSGKWPFRIVPGACVDLPAGVAVEGPPDVWFMLVGRSSSFRNRGLLVNPAVIDPGYRGELFAVTRNVGRDRQLIEPGERIAQLIPIGMPRLDVRVVEKLSDSDRGTNGFGSSGR